jgi:hypothetical protein
MRLSLLQHIIFIQFLYYIAAPYSIGLLPLEHIFRGAQIFRRVSHPSSALPSRGSAAAAVGLWLRPSASGAGDAHVHHCGGSDGGFSCATGPPDYEIAAAVIVSNTNAGVL